MSNIPIPSGGREGRGFPDEMRKLTIAYLPSCRDLPDQCACRKWSMRSLPRISLVGESAYMLAGLPAAMQYASSACSFTVC